MFGAVLEYGPKDKIGASEGGGFLGSGFEEGGGGDGKAAEDGQHGIFAAGKDDLGGNIVIHKSKLAIKGKKFKRSTPEVQATPGM